MQSVPREWLDFLRQQFPKDSRIQLTEIGGNPRPISPGSTGKLDYIDDAGQFHVKWDNGCTLALVLGEDRFSVYLPEPQTFKLYMPLTADFYGRDEWGDMSEDGEEWDGRTLMDYEGQILSALVKNRVPEENESGLMHWYGEDDSVDHKVRSAVFTVEVRNRQLWGVAECRVAGELTPEELKARWFAGSALNTAEQAMASVISTVLSRLNAFLDSEMEQILCFDTAIDAEKFCNEKSAIFIVLPEEDQTKYFMVSLILQNLYREILTVADENGGRLKNRVVFFADELGTCPPIQSLELMFSASRSRGLMLVPIVQSITGQLQKNYGKEGSEIIVDNCQVNLYGGFAPASQTAVELSKSLGSRTVMSGSISRGKNDPSQSLQMMERPLMTPDELKSMPKGSFIVAKTGVHPMKVKLRLFLDWGIRFGMPYEVPEKAQRFVAYADKQELEESIIRRHYGTIVMDSEQPQGGGTSAGGMAQGIQAAPDSRKTVFRP